MPYLNIIYSQILGIKMWNKMGLIISPTWRMWGDRSSFFSFPFSVFFSWKWSELAIIYVTTELAYPLSFSRKYKAGDLGRQKKCVLCQWWKMVTLSILPWVCWCYLSVTTKWHHHAQFPFGNVKGNASHSQAALQAENLLPPQMCPERVFCFSS